MDKLILKFLNLNCFLIQQKIYSFSCAHPDFPNLKVINDTPDYFGIENLAVNLSKGHLAESFPAWLKDETKPKKKSPDV